MSKLTHKQQAFVDAYCGPSKGNATDAARRAGYKGTDRALQVMGANNISKPIIAAAIAARAAQVASSRIMTIEQMQEMLSDLAAQAASNGESQIAINAIKELGKMRGAYIERKEITVAAQVDTTTKVDVSKLSKETLLELARAKRDV